MDDQSMRLYNLNPAVGAFWINLHNRGEVYEFEYQVVLNFYGGVLSTAECQPMLRGDHPGNPASKLQYRAADASPGRSRDNWWSNSAFTEPT
jgi:hypothetical protein